MTPPPAFHAFTHGLHQDGWLLANGSLERLAIDCLGFVAPSDRAELRRFLAWVIETKTPAEMKGLLNRGKRDIRLDSGGAKRFLEVALAEAATG